MRKFLARFFSFALIVVVMISFTACSLFSENLDKKYSETTLVASAAGANIGVSKRELYNAYVDWGYQYASQMGIDDLLKSLTDYILNQKILKQISIEKFGEIRDVEKAIARKNAYEAVDTVLRSYVYEALNRDDPANTTSSDSETDAVTYEEYNKTILVDTSGSRPSFTLNLTSYEDTYSDVRLVDYEKYAPNMPGDASDKVAKQALSRFVRGLKTQESGFENLTNATTYLNLDDYLIQNLSKDERYVLNRRLQRLIDDNETSILTSRLSTAYNLGIENQAEWDDYLNRATDFDLWQEAVNADVSTWDNTAFNATKGKSIAESIAANVSDFYKRQVRAAINDYKLSTPADLETTIMGSSLEDIYYIPTSVANNLFTVSHILIGFTDEQKERYAEINSNTDPSFDRQNALENLYAEVKTSDGKFVYDVYLEVQSALNNAGSLQQKYELFRDFIYQYNTDPGMQNPSYEYLMSVNKDKNSMIEAFTDASLALKANGEKGAISGVVWGEYGAHIIMYTRDVAEFIWTGDESMLDANYAKTLFATQTCYGNKTKFDTLAESFTRTYSDYESVLLREFKQAHQVSVYTNEFKNFI